MFIWFVWLFLEKSHFYLLIFFFWSWLMLKGCFRGVAHKSHSGVLADLVHCQTLAGVFWLLTGLCGRKIPPTSQHNILISTCAGMLFISSLIVLQVKIQSPVTFEVWFVFKAPKFNSQVLFKSISTDLTNRVVLHKTIREKKRRKEKHYCSLKCTHSHLQSAAGHRGRIILVWFILRIKTRCVYIAHIW